MDDSSHLPVAYRRKSARCTIGRPLTRMVTVTSYPCLASALMFITQSSFCCPPPSGALSLCFHQLYYLCITFCVVLRHNSLCITELSIYVQIPKGFLQRKPRFGGASPWWPLPTRSSILPRLGCLSTSSRSNPSYHHRAIPFFKPFPAAYPRIHPLFCRSSDFEQFSRAKPAFFLPSLFSCSDFEKSNKNNLLYNVRARISSSLLLVYHPPLIRVNRTIIQRVFFNSTVLLPIISMFLSRFSPANYNRHSARSRTILP